MPQAEEEGDNLSLDPSWSKSLMILRAQCHIENFPCSRCRRLKIPCLGHGQQRWKFKDETVNLKAGSENKPGSQSSVSQEQTLILHPSYSPSNKTTMLASALVKRVDLSVDVRFQLTLNFGGFLLDIPRHLGTSAALDAAADSLVAAHARFCSGDRSLEHDVLAKQSRALSTLRHDLDDSVKARSSETLCAAMVLMIAQVRQSACLPFQGCLTSSTDIYDPI